MKNLINYKGKNIKYGRYLFNKCLPENYPLVDEHIDKTRLFEILNSIALNYPPETTMKTLDNIKELGFKVSTEHGFTLSMDDLYDKKFDKHLEKIKPENDINTNLDIIKNNKSINKIIKSKPYYNYISSGARGSFDQMSQLVVSRGYVSNSNNEILPNLIKSNLVKGLNPEEYFYSSWGTRKGLLDTANQTALSGHFTRQLIYNSVSTVLGDEDDCGTDEYLTLDVSIRNSDGELDENKTEKYARTLIWRYIVAGKDNKLYLVTTENYKALMGKKIKVRSPIYCNSKHICKKCYGNLSNILHSDQIGIIAAQTLGERTTQLTLRSFHVSGNVKGIHESGKNDDIISGMGLVNKICHVSDPQFKDYTPEQMVSRLITIFIDYGIINSIHFEIILTSMMWYKDELWRTMKNRNNYPYTWESILQTPNKQSWILGLAFSRLQNRLLDGLIKNKVDVPSSISNIFRY